MPTGSGTNPADLTGVTRQFTDFVKTLKDVAVASQGVFSALKAGIGAIKSQVESFVELSNPAAVRKFQFAVQDLYAAIGTGMVPVLNNFTTVIQKLADYFQTLSPATKTMIAGLTAAAIGFTVVTVAVIALNTAFSTLTGGLSTVLGAVGAAVAGILFAASGTDELKTAMDSLLGPLSEVLDAVSEIVTALATALAPIAETVFGLLAAALKQVASAVQSIIPEMMRFAAWVRAIAEFLAEAIGLDLQPGQAPPKAQGAIRPAQIGGVNDFLNRQLVSALQGSSPQQKQLNVMEGMKEDVAAIRRIIEEYIGNAKNFGAGLRESAQNFQQGNLLDFFFPRQVMNQVIGK